MPKRGHPSPSTQEIEDSSIKHVLSFRLPPSTVRWLKAEAERRGWSMSATVYRIVEDLENWFGFPPTITDQLAADRKALGLDWRDYLMHLMTRRFEDVRRNGPGFDAKK